MSSHLSDRNTSLDDCAAALELVPAYSLGATDPDETRLVEQMLALCPDVAAELATYEGLYGALLAGEPQAAPPAKLGANIMAALAESERAAQPTAPPAPKIVPNGATERPAPAPAKASQVAPRLSWIAAGAAAALLIVSNLYWLNQMNSLRQREESLLALMQRQDALLTALGGADIRRVELAASAAALPGAAAVVWNPAEPLGLLTVRDLPALAPDRTYQFWLIGDGQPVSGGTFVVNPDGSGALVFESSAPLDSFAAFGITEEPAGGSPAPTMNPILLGNLS